ncbi:DUF2892 domain-containing protein [Cytobacillus solani]|uniref:Inner membrane protein YgaP-like transmembrane domain-containing protein n=1 Tax=Cytobacillus solani TaxID=1637975 RepID=A0A0Q3QJL4_9BACI|nr:DUF2892 domain-containing protein [Cytobacillus solani]KQL17760.1 hypothetical protein AN957_03465 [Cytobacillus solani]USK55569.1 DUF2892 domain-containing protein [Cytobacillus solani]
MNIKPNIGIVNALIRITCGLTLVACSTAKLTKKPWRESYMILAFLGAMKVAEGIVRFCPITALFENRQELLGSMNQNGNGEDIEISDILPYNPS